SLLSDRYSEHRRARRPLLHVLVDLVALGTGSVTSFSIASILFPRSAAVPKPQQCITRSSTCPCNDDASCRILGDGTRLSGTSHVFRPAPAGLRRAPRRVRRLSAVLETRPRQR